jgi:enamine deaminase RidA (YjgF/YER057c/UK114 family)
MRAGTMRADRPSLGIGDVLYRVAKLSFRSGHPPSRSLGTRLGARQDGANRYGRAPVPKQQIRSDRLRQPSGIFSHATMIEATGRLVFISGMTSRRADGTIAGVGDIEAQTRQVCENIKAAVEAAGGTMDDICRVDVYIRNMEQFDAIHKVRREYFREPLPASTMVEVVKMTHPDYLIEINAIAVIP